MEVSRTPCDEQADKEHIFYAGEWWCVPKGTTPDNPGLKVALEKVKATRK